MRRASGNLLDGAVLTAHVKTATSVGVLQAFLIEGRVSDDGRLGTRASLLDYAVRSLDPDTGRDVAFVPVAVNYDGSSKTSTSIQIVKASSKWTSPTGT